MEENIDQGLFGVLVHPAGNAPVEGDLTPPPSCIPPPAQVAMPGPDGQALPPDSVSTSHTVDVETAMLIPVIAPSERCSDPPKCVHGFPASKAQPTTLYATAWREWCPDPVAP